MGFSWSHSPLDHGGESGKKRKKEGGRKRGWGEVEIGREREIGKTHCVKEEDKRITNDIKHVSVPWS